MSWIDIFYPDIPEKRKELIEKNEKIVDLMESNFYYTNELIDVLDQHYHYSFKRIELNKNDTIASNCNVLINCMHEIQAEVHEIDQELKTKLEPELYEKLMKMSITVDEYEKNAHIFDATIGAVGFTASVALGGLIYKGAILKNLISSIGKIKTGLVGGIALTVVCMGIDMIVSAIAGKLERDQLEKGLKEYDEALKDFIPRSREYEEVIIEVKISLEKHIK